MASDAAAEAGSPSGDANDYSKWDNMSESDDEAEVSDDKDALTVAERVQKAGTSKVEGNELFKSSDNAKAADSYRAGVTLLEEVTKSKPGPSAAEQNEIRELKLSLNLNLAMAEIKLEHWNAAIKASTAALALDATNVKALFRRGVASSRSGAFQGAKTDLSKVLELDETNRSAKVELQKCKKKMLEHKQQEKKNFSGFFDRAGEGFYDDKEKERKEKEKKKAAELADKKKKWEAENERRKAAEGEEEITFDDWSKEEEEKEKKRKKDEEEKEKEKRKAAKGSRARSSKAESVDVDEDLAGVNLRGYKKTSDGRTTSFFNNELDDKAKALIGDIAPKPIARSASSDGGAAADAASNPPTAGGGPQRIDAGASGPAAGASAWNANGNTWEDRDCSEWAKDQLTKHLKQGSAASGLEDFRHNPKAVVDAMTGLDLGAYSRGEEGKDASMDKLGELASKLAKVSAKIVKVKKVEGDASVAVVRGTKRYLYDLNAELEYEVVYDESFGVDGESEPEKDKVVSTPLRETKYKGTITMSEIGSVTDDPPELSLKPKKEVPERHKQRVEQILVSLRKDLTGRRLDSFVSDFKAAF